MTRDCKIDSDLLQQVAAASREIGTPIKLIVEDSIKDSLMAMEKGQSRG